MTELEYSVLSSVQEYSRPRLIEYLQRVYYHRERIALILSGEVGTGKRFLADNIKQVFAQRNLVVNIVNAPVDWSKENHDADLTLILSNKQVNTSILFS